MHKNIHVENLKKNMKNMFFSSSKLIKKHNSSACSQNILVTHTPYIVDIVIVQQ